MSHIANKFEPNMADYQGMNKQEMTYKYNMMPYLMVIMLPFGLRCQFQLLFDLRFFLKGKSKNTHKIL